MKVFFAQFVQSSGPFFADIKNPNEAWMTLSISQFNSTILELPEQAHFERHLITKSGKTNVPFSALLRKATTHFSSAKLANWPAT